MPIEGTCKTRKNTRKEPVPNYVWYVLSTFRSPKAKLQVFRWYGKIYVQIVKCRAVVSSLASSLLFCLTLDIYYNFNTDICQVFFRKNPPDLQAPAMSIG